MRQALPNISSIKHLKSESRSESPEYVNPGNREVSNWLVVSTPLKNMKVNGKDHPIYYGKKNV